VPGDGKIEGKEEGQVKDCITKKLRGGGGPPGRKERPGTNWVIVIR